MSQLKKTKHKKNICTILITKSPVDDADAADVVVDVHPDLLRDALEVVQGLVLLGGQGLRHNMILHISIVAMT